MKIGEFSKRTATPASTIRYYEKIRLLPNANRVHGQRVYPDTFVDVVDIINEAKKAGFSLEEIRTLIREVSDTDSSEKILQKKITEIENTIERYQNMKRVLIGAIEKKCLDDFASSLSVLKTS